LQRDVQSRHSPKALTLESAKDGPRDFELE
jgi:hypothetical protein